MIKCVYMCVCDYFFFPFKRFIYLEFVTAEVETKDKCYLQVARWPKKAEYG